MYNCSTVLGSVLCINKTWSNDANVTECPCHASSIFGTGAAAAQAGSNAGCHPPYDTTLSLVSNFVHAFDTKNSSIA